MSSVTPINAPSARENDTLPLLGAPRRDSTRLARGRLATVVGALVVASAGAVLALTCILIQGRDPPSASLPDADTLFTFLAVGDWGRGNTNQRKCMQRMNTVAEGWTPRFVVSTGDNFYPDGLSGPQDPKISSHFTNMYSHKSLQVPWYAVLGNHDYGDGWKSDPEHLQCGTECRSPKWQFTEHQQQQDLRWHCQNGTRVMSFHNNALAMLFIDTVPMIPRYASQPWAQYEGGYQDQDLQAQLADIQSSLQSPEFQSATWRIVVGHHAVRSYGEHCENEHTDCNAMNFLLPWLHNASVHMYLNGHDHDLQHIKFPNETTHFITSGAGSDCRAGEFVSIKTPYAKYLSDLQGFVAVAVSKTKLTASFFVYNAERAEHKVELLAGSHSRP